MAATTKSNQTNNTNGFDQFDLIRKEFKRYQLIPLSIIYAVGLLANSLVIFNGIRRRKIIRHYSNYFVLSMAFADWSALFFTIPMIFVEYLAGFKWMSEFVCQYILQIRETFQGAAVFSISTLAILRVRQVIKNPLGQCSKRACWIMVATIWLISFLVCTVPLLDLYRISPIGTCEAVWPSPLRVKVHVTLIYCIIISPMVVATISYGILIFKVTQPLGSDTETVRIVKRNRSVAVLLVMLILSCWVSYTPAAVYLMINIYTDIEYPPVTWHVITILYFGGSALNPILVLLTMPKDYQLNVECKRQRRVGVEQADEEHKDAMKSTIVLQERNGLHEIHSP